MRTKGESDDIFAEGTSNHEVFAIKGNEAFIGYKLENGNFHFVQVPYTEPFPNAQQKLLMSNDIRLRLAIQGTNEANMAKPNDKSFIKVEEILNLLNKLEEYGFKIVKTPKTNSNNGKFKPNINHRKS